jgi:hypothetical protein
MRNLHIILGRRSLSQDGDVAALYVGIDGDAAISARDSALASGEFELVETVPYHNGVLRYADPDAVAAFAARKAAAAEVVTIEEPAPVEEIPSGNRKRHR